jgi:hypothetical protein
MVMPVCMSCTQSASLYLGAEGQYEDQTSSQSEIKRNKLSLKLFLRWCHIQLRTILGHHPGLSEPLYFRHKFFFCLHFNRSSRIAPLDGPKSRISLLSSALENRTNFPNVEVLINSDNGQRPK